MMSTRYSPKGAARWLRYKRTVLVPLIALAMLAGCESAPAKESGENSKNDQRAQIMRKNEVSDASVTNTVKQAIANDPVLKSEEIIVETSGGVVVLSGFVSSIIVMEKAVSVAKGVDGVKDVKDTMRLKWQF